MSEHLSYEEWREADRRALEAARGAFGGVKPDNGPRYAPTGHPVDLPLPATNDAAYDAQQARQQVHSHAARDVAGFDSRTLDEIRRALDEGREPTLPPGWTMTSSPAARDRQRPR